MFGTKFVEKAIFKEIFQEKFHNEKQSKHPSFEI